MLSHAAAMSVGKMIIPSDGLMEAVQKSRLRLYRSSRLALLLSSFAVRA